MKKQENKGISLNIFKSKRFFIALAIVLLILLAVFVINNFSFLIKNLNNALNVDMTKEQGLKFDIEGFGKLNLIR